jgi:hypothetical protein
MKHWLLALALASTAACSRSAPAPAAEPGAEKQAKPAESVAVVEAPTPEVEADKVPKGSPADISAAQLRDAEGVALVPTEGPISDDVLNLFLAQPTPVGAWVGGAFDAPTTTEWDGQSIRDALVVVAEEKKSVDKQRGAIRGRVQAIVKAGREGELPKGKPLSRGLPSLDAMIPALDAIKVDVFPTPGPLMGGADQGMAVATLSLVFAARLADAVVKGDGVEIYLWSRRMARFGALVATQARTLGELLGAVTAVQDALAMAEIGTFRTVALLPDGTTRAMNNLRQPRQRLGTWASSLSRVGTLFRDPVNVKLWTRVARSQPDPMWRYEAFKALFMHGAFHKGEAGADEARAAVATMAQDPAKELRDIASHWKARLDKVL